MLLTIITINKNNANKLALTLESFKDAAIFQDVQFIFVDGASTDNSLEIAKQFYSYVDIVSEADSGVYNAMNKGLARAKGKYVMWINSGDELVHGAAMVIRQKLMKTSAKLVVFAINLISDFSEKPPRQYYPSMGDLPSSTFPHQSTIFDREALIGIGGYSESYSVVSDRDAILKMFFSGVEILVEKDIISNFNVDGISSTPQAYLEGLLLDRKYGLYGYIELIRRLRRVHRVMGNKLFPHLIREWIFKRKGADLF